VLHHRRNPLQPKKLFVILFDETCVERVAFSLRIWEVPGTIRTESFRDFPASPGKPQFRTEDAAFFLVGWDLRHQVLRPLLAYCTAPNDR
jgi:hypothetical protein